jgi:general secretion pathway protein C
LIALLVLLAAPAGVEAPTAAAQAHCTPVAPDIGVPVSFKKGATVGDLVKWAGGVTCEQIELDDAERAEKLTVAANGELRASEVRPFTVALAASANVAIGARGCSRNLAKSIKAIDEKTFELERAAMEKLIGNAACLTGSARIVPAFKAGKADGFRLFAIKDGTLYALLGFQNGDTVKSVNGLKLDNPDDAVAAYGRLKAVRELKLEVERRGAPLQLVWKLQ